MFKRLKAIKDLLWAAALGLALLALLVFALSNRIWPAVLVSGAVIIAGGAGANGNRVLAVGVAAGMAVGTIALLFVTPVFFMLFQKLHERFQGKEEAEEAEVETVTEK